MIELVRTNDLVVISHVEAILAAEGIRYFIADQHMSALEGAIGMLPRRVLVDATREAMARRLLTEAGLKAELRPEAAGGS